MTDPDPQHDPNEAAEPAPRAGAENDFEPFANDTQVLTLADGRGELSIENGTDSVLLHGDLEFPATRQGLANARALREALTRVEAVIESRLEDAPGATPRRG